MAKASGIAAWWPSSCIHQLSSREWKLPRCVAETANSTSASTQSARRPLACDRVINASGTISRLKETVSSWNASVELGGIAGHHRADVKRRRGGRQRVRERDDQTDRTGARAPPSARPRPPAIPARGTRSPAGRRCRRRGRVEAGRRRRARPGSRRAQQRGCQEQPVHAACPAARTRPPARSTSTSSMA